MVRHSMFQDAGREDQEPCETVAETARPSGDRLRPALRRLRPGTQGGEVLMGEAVERAACTMRVMVRKWFSVFAHADTIGGIRHTQR